jgi:hypothetical protein
MKRREIRRGSRPKPSARRPARARRRPAAPVHLTAAEEPVALRAAWDRSARRWLLLWQFLVEFLEREAADVHERLHRRLAHYGLAKPFARLVETPGSLPVLEWMVAPALLSAAPPPKTIHRLEAMAADTTLVERRGRKTETPLWHALIFYECYRERARRDPTVLRCKETPENYAIRGLSTRWGRHLAPASWMKLLRRARREPGLEDLARRIARAKDDQGRPTFALLGEL